MAENPQEQRPKSHCVNCGKTVLRDESDGVWFHDDALGSVRCDGRAYLKEPTRKEVAVPQTASEGHHVLCSGKHACVDAAGKPLPYTTSGVHHV